MADNAAAPSAAAAAAAHHHPDAADAAVAKLRAWADAGAAACDHTPEQSAWLLRPGLLRRYAVARNGDYEGALAMLKGTLEWRREAAAPPLGCALCDEDFTSHCFWPVGRCLDSSVLIYGNPPRASTAAVPETLKHVVQYLMSALEREDEADLNGRWTWAVDFNSFGWTHAMQARLGASFASVFADHFPERLSKLILINPPYLFNVLLHAIRPFADARTLSKVVTVTGDPKSVADQIVAFGLFRRDDEVLLWLEKTLGMEGTPGNLPPFPKEALRFIPHSATWKGVPGHMTSSPPPAE